MLMMGGSQVMLMMRGSQVMTEATPEESRRRRALVTHGRIQDPPPHQGRIQDP